MTGDSKKVFDDLTRPSPEHVAVLQLPAARSEQVTGELVIAVPPSAVIERDEKQVASFQLLDRVAEQLAVAQGIPHLLLATPC